MGVLTPPDEKAYKKMLKGMPPNMADKLNSMSDEELEKEVVVFDSGIRNVKDELANDKDVNMLKENLKVSRDPYKTEIKELECSRDYAIDLLKKRGKY